MTTRPDQAPAAAAAWDSSGLARALFEQSPFSSVMYDPSGRPVALNAAFRAMWGVGIESVPPDYTVLSDPELERRGALPHIRRAFAGEVVVTPPIRYDIARVSATGRGHALWTQGYFFPVRDESGVLTHVVLTHIDLTAQKEAEEALRASEERMQLAQQAAQIGVFDWHVPSGRVAWTEVEERIFGLAPGQFEGTIDAWGRHVLPEDLGRMQREMADAMARHERELAFAFRISRPDGEVRRIEGRAAFLYAEDGSPLRMVGVNIDVTDRARLDEALRESEAQLRETQRIARVGSWAWDVATNRLSWSDVLCELYGLPPGSTPPDFEAYVGLVHPEDRELARTVVERALEGEDGFAFDHRVIWPDGSVRRLHARGRVVRDDAGGVVRMVGSSIDVTEQWAATAALQASEERTRAIVESVTDPLIAYDREWRIVYLNEPARGIFRHARVATDPVGHALWGLVPWLHGSELESAMRRAMDARAPTTFEARLRSGAWIEIRTYPTGDGLVAYWKDVTETRRSRERAELLAAASAALAETVRVDEALSALLGFTAQHLADYCSVHLVNEDGSLRLVDVVHRDPSRAAAARELEARYPLLVDAPVGAPAVIRSGRASLQTELPPERLRLAARDADHLALLERLGIVSTMVVPLTARGRTLGALTLVAAESGRRYRTDDLALVEELGRRAALAVDNARLYAEADAARREAEEARARAEEANRAKTEFLTTMSHELRTPLNAIAGYAGLLEMGVRGPMTDEQREDLQRIQRSQKHLLGLINEVLNYARLESGMVTYDLRPTLVAEAVSAAAALVEPQRTAKRLALDIRLPEFAGRPPLHVTADPEKLQQILLNLLSNAVKFTPDGGRVVVELAEAPGAPAAAALRVSDTGIGIPPDKLEAIFEPFVQVGRSLSNPGEGTGLGLAISRDLARGMGGDLTVESTVGEGSTFTLTLPQA